MSKWVKNENLKSLSNLEFLSIEFRYIFPLRPSLFRNLRNLKKLILSEINLEKYEYSDIENVFDDLVNLEYLKCSFSNMSNPKFPFKINRLLKLKWLHLYGFIIDQKLIESIKSPNICVINLKYCEIEENIFIDNLPSLKG